MLRKTFMCKKIFATVLIFSCFTTQCTNDQKTTETLQQELEQTQVESAQKVLESMDKRWKPCQMAYAAL